MAAQNAMSDLEASLIQSSTTIAVVYNAGVLVAACSGLSRGGVRVWDDADRIYELDNRALFTGSGILVTQQDLITEVLREMKFHELSYGSKLNIRQIAFMLSRKLYRRRMKFNPALVNTIISGMDGETPYIARIDMHGTKVEDSFAVTGFGNWFAINLLRYEADKEMDLESAKNLIMRCYAILAAADNSVGSKVSFKTVTRKGTSAVGVEKIMPNNSAVEHLKADLEAKYGPIPATN